MKNVNTKPKQIIYATRKPENPQRERLRQKAAALWVGLVALMIILPLIFISGTIIYFQVNNLNLPYVFIFDQNVGLISRDETEALVDLNWNQNRTIQLVNIEDPQKAYSFKPQELGIWVDSQATARSAYDFGRSYQPFKELLIALQGQSQIVMPVLHFDSSRAQETLESLADDLDISPVDATVVFHDGDWNISPGIDGHAIDINTTFDSLSNNTFSILLEGSLPFHLQTIPPDVADLTPLLGEIKKLASQEITITAYDPIEDQYFKWSVPLEQKSSWVSVEAHTYEIDIVIEPDDVDALFAAWSNELGDGRSFEPDLNTGDMIKKWQAGETPLITVHHDPTTYVVRQGESLWSISLKLGMPLWYIIDANPGLNIDNLSVGMELTIPSKNVLLPLPVVPDKRVVIDISQQRMTVYEDGQVRNTHIVSTGVEDSPTMAGVFQIQTHQHNAYASNWDLYMPHFLGIYEAWPGFMNGIHGLPMLSSGRRLWSGNLGTPVSYGCIILDLNAAEDLYHWADRGVVVEIRN